VEFHPPSTPHSPKNDDHIALLRRRREIFSNDPSYVFCLKFGAKVQGGRQPCTSAPKARKCEVVNKKRHFLSKMRFFGQECQFLAIFVQKLLIVKDHFAILQILPTLSVDV
jgi:hypothetical protein